MTTPTLPEASEARKDVPLCSGVVDYFPAALAEVAKLSKAGGDKHNPGQPLHWSRGKSNDHADCIARHLVDRGTFAEDGTRHSAALAWRALALLQEELEAEGAPLARGARDAEQAADEDGPPYAPDFKSNDLGVWYVYYRSEDRLRRTLAALGLCQTITPSILFPGFYTPTKAVDQTILDRFPDTPQRSSR
jgi:hypothetical protein